MNPNLPINPWLAGLIADYRSSYSTEALREDYRKACESGIRRSWGEHLAACALQEALAGNSFLRTPRHKMNLPAATKETLNKLYVNNVADLMQLTAEDFESLPTDMAPAAKKVNSYLNRHGLHLYHSAGKTAKMASDSVLQEQVYVPSVGSMEQILEAPERMLEFNLERPSLQDEWFEEYYARYEHLEGEEELSGPLKNIRPDVLTDNYLSFFSAVRNMWHAYEEVCPCLHIGQTVAQPAFPISADEMNAFGNERLVGLRKEMTRVLLSVLEQLPSLDKRRVADFLCAKDNDRLDIANEIRYQALQLLLVENVEIRVALENILLDLTEQSKRPDQTTLAVDNTPPNPWLVAAIREFRRGRSVKTLRNQYKSYVERYPKRSWSVFIEQSALKRKLQKEPLLLTPTESFNIPGPIKKILLDYDINNLSDLLQFSFKELSDILDEYQQNITSIVRYLRPLGYSLASDDHKTYKVSLFEE